MHRMVHATHNAFSDWRESVDLWSLGVFSLFMCVGALLMLSISDTADARLQVQALRQVFLLPFFFLILVLSSFLSHTHLGRLALIGFACSYLLLTMTAFLGIEINGAKRWLRWAGVSFQASELIKPCFAVATAWILSQGRAYGRFPGVSIAFVLLLAVLFPLAFQPDLGQSFLIALAWMVQACAAGLSLVWFFAILLGLLVGVALAWLFLPYVALRVRAFLDPSQGDRYQVDLSLDSFRTGGFLGLGPGEGVLKTRLPDAQGDFIFSVIGEELGFVVCVLLVTLFVSIGLRALFRLAQSRSLFAILAGIGLLVQLIVQTFINIFSTLDLIPPKGMTLPLISYGGSSLLSVSIAAGALLALTRRRREVDA